MQQYKNFTQTGNQYKLKLQYGFNTVICGAFLLATIIGFVKIPGSSFKWWMLGITIIMLWATFTNSCIIDMDKKEIRIKPSLLKPALIIPLVDLQGFTIHKLKQYGFITINVSLIANYTKDGKDKEVGLTQHFFTKPIQGILNDIDEITGGNG
ncbi:MAG: hypothetical protein KF862_07730 [Chitinophagaceae bacterium]|nr:hypothetical protein [Chitinophagaceae bacterium]